MKSPIVFPDSTVRGIARRSREASRSLARLSNERRNEILQAISRSIEIARDEILEASERDCMAAEGQLGAEGASRSPLPHVRLRDHAIDEMAMRVRDVAKFPDPLGRRLSITELDPGLVLHRTSCPLGVVGVIFESRPDAVPEAAALTLKSGNALILKGGSGAEWSSQALVSVIRDCLDEFPEVPAHGIELLPTGTDVGELLELDREVDLIIPRGSKELVEHVLAATRIPVLGYGDGMCHVYVDSSADIRKALEIITDSKSGPPGRETAAETLLVHQTIVRDFLPEAVKRLRSSGVELRGCRKMVALFTSSLVHPASDEDWGKEHCNPLLMIKIVAHVDEAIAHIHRYGSRRAEVIVTEDSGTANRFMEEVDAAGVFRNASIRFADVFRHGFGSELGGGTNEWPGRERVSIEGLTKYKYKLFGNGETVADYSSGKRQFKPRKIE